METMFEVIDNIRTRIPIPETLSSRETMAYIHGRNYASKFVMDHFRSNPSQPLPAFVPPKSIIRMFSLDDLGAWMLGFRCVISKVEEYVDTLVSMGSRREK